jgi:hypothetical protein
MLCEASSLKALVVELVLQGWVVELQEWVALVEWAAAVTNLVVAAPALRCRICIVVGFW